MAELPRYRPLGVTIQPLPGVDFAAAGRARASAFREIARGLDMMSKYAYEKQQYQAAAEGQRYGAEKAPTQEQLEEAKKEGADIAEMLPGDDYTVFGRAARKTSLDIIIDQSEMEARKSLSALRLEADQTDMPATELSAKINGLISGYSSNLYELNPAAGSKFQAAMSTVGNTALLSHSQSLAKKAEKQQEVAALGAIDSIINDTLPDIFNAGASVNAETGEVVTIDQKIDLERDRIFGFSYAIGDKALADQKVRAFDKKVFEYKTTYLSNWTMQSPRENMRQIKTEVFRDYRAEQMWRSLSEPEQMAVRDVIRKTEVANNSLMTSRESVNELARKNRLRVLTPDIIDGLRDGQDMSVELDEVRDLNPEEYEKLIAVRDTKGGVDDADTMEELNLLTSNGKLTQQDVIDAILDKKLTVGTADTYFKRVASSQDNREKRARGVLSRAFDGVDLAQRGRALETAERKLAAQLAEHLEFIDIQKVKDPNFDAFEYAVKVSKDRRSSAGQTSQSDDLMTGINAQIETFPTLSQLTDIDLMIGEAQRLLNEPYVEGGLFKPTTGLSHQRRLLLQDALKQMQKVKKLGAGQ